MTSTGVYRRVIAEGTAHAGGTAIGAPGEYAVEEG